MPLQDRSNLGDEASECLTFMFGPVGQECQISRLFAVFNDEQAVEVG